MAEQTDLVDLQSPVYDPCRQTERGEEMNMQEMSVRCKDCYYYTSGTCNMSLLDKTCVQPDDYCSYWVSNISGNEYVAGNIILGIREEKKK